MVKFDVGMVSESRCMDGNQVRFEYFGSTFISRFKDPINLSQYTKLIAHLQEKRSAHLVMLGPFFDVIVKFQEMSKIHVGMVCQFSYLDGHKDRFQDSGTTFI